MKLNKLSAACIACAGMIFCCGFTGVKPSPETEAVKLLQKSAEKGNYGSGQKLRFYFNGWSGYG